MFNLYEIMANAQGGDAMRNLGRLYGMTPEQTQRAIDALLPAFSMGLKRTTQSPDGMAQLFGMMAQGPYAEWFENASRMYGQAIANNQRAFGMGALDPSTVQAGNDVLSMIFGSKEMSRAVANQAAAFSGIGTEVMKSMLPMIASMIMGGLFRGMQGQFGGGQAAQAGSGNIFMDMLEQMMRGGAPGGQGGGFPMPGGGGGGFPMPGGGGMPNPMGDILGQMLEGMLGGQRGAPGREAPDSQGFPPFGGGRGGASQGGGQDGAAYPDLSEMSRQLEAMGRSGQDMMGQMFGQMFDTGREVQKTHLDTMQQIFDTFLGTPERKR